MSVCVCVCLCVCDTYAQCIAEWVRSSRGPYLSHSSWSSLHLVSLCRRRFHMRVYPHLSWTVSFSTEACRSSEVVWVLCRTSLSSWSCSSVSDNSPRTTWSCPSSIWARRTQLSLSASQRWSVSSRSTTWRQRGEREQVKEHVEIQI